MYSSKLHKCSRDCSCGNDEFVLEFNHEDKTWLMYCWVCMATTQPFNTEWEAVKMWEEGNVSGLAGTEPR